MSKSIFYHVAFIKLIAISRKFPDILVDAHSQASRILKLVPRVETSTK